MTDLSAEFGAPPSGRERWVFSIILVVAALWSGIGAAYPQNSWLQIGPVLVVASVFPFARNWPLSNLSTSLIAGFLLLHLFAARWTYSDVPYDAWLSAIGIDSAKLFGTTRNMFDRLVHFAFGLLAVRPVIEWERRVAGVDRRLSLRLATLFVLSVSAAYEIFEWTLAIVMSPEAADRYNGQQGDMFDAQKDMWLALAGALVALAMLSLRRAIWQRS